MAKYVYTYRGGSLPETDEERAAAMAAWTSWLGGMGPAALDRGNPFGASSSVTTGGVGSAAAAPLGGYSIIAADSLEAAAEMARGCPVLTTGGSVDVHEVVEIM
jgi:YCII-related domain-containing protein